MIRTELRVAPAATRSSLIPDLYTERRIRGVGVGQIPFVMIGRISRRAASVIDPDSDG